MNLNQDFKNERNIKSMPLKKTYYEISEGCVSCGACKVVCPVHCISKGQPYIIQKNKCIGCGQCVSRCWRQVIYKKNQ